MRAFVRMHLYAHVFRLHGHGHARTDVDTQILRYIREYSPANVQLLSEAIYSGACELRALYFRE